MGGTALEMSPFAFNKCFELLKDATNKQGAIDNLLGFFNPKVSKDQVTLWLRLGFPFDCLRLLSLVSGTSEMDCLGCVADAVEQVLICVWDLSQNQQHRSTNFQRLPSKTGCFLSVPIPDGQDVFARALDDGGNVSGEEVSGEQTLSLSLSLLFSDSTKQRLSSWQLLPLSCFVSSDTFARLTVSPTGVRCFLREFSIFFFSLSKIGDIESVDKSSAVDKLVIKRDPSVPQLEVSMLHMEIPPANRDQFKQAVSQVFSGCSPSFFWG